MPDYKNMTSVAALRHAKEQSGKTAEEIARECDISTAVMHRYLRMTDAYSPGLHVLPQLCKAMGNTVLQDWLAAQTGSELHLPAVQSRAEVLTAVARATVALGEVSSILVATEKSGITPANARAIRASIAKVKSVCDVVQAQLQDVAASPPGENLILFQTILPGVDDADEDEDEDTV